MSLLFFAFVLSIFWVLSDFHGFSCSLCLCALHSWALSDFTASLALFAFLLFVPGCFQISTASLAHCTCAIRPGGVFGFSQLLLHLRSLLLGVFGVPQLLLLSFHCAFRSKPSSRTVLRTLTGDRYEPQPLLKTCVLELRHFESKILRLADFLLCDFGLSGC